jgi:hypothetical protein
VWQLDPRRQLSSARCKELSSSVLWCSNTTYSLAFFSYQHLGVPTELGSAVVTLALP